MTDTKPEPERVALVMRKEALKNRGKGPSFRIFRGWRFGLSRGEVPMPSREDYERLHPGIAQRLGTQRFDYDEAMAAAKQYDYDEWILSASLHPRGRASTEEDWRFLGEMVGWFGAPLDSLRTPIETTEPGDVHYWMWSDEKEGN
jgi:hypothetical protein